MIAPLERAFENSSHPEREQLGFIPKSEDDTESDADGMIRAPAYTKFDEFYKRRLLWYLEHYQIAVEKGINDEGRRLGDPFISMPFEGAGNIMSGEWNYLNLKARLSKLRDKVLEETHQWPTEGMALVKADAGIAVKLAGQHEQIAAEMKDHPQVVDVSLVDKNPFLWQLTYVGRTESKLEGGIVKIKIYISPRHPEEQPRVFVESPIYHIRVSKLGVLMYLPSHDEDIRHHIDGIVSSLDDDNPPFNPLMTVHPEATALCWGSELERRLYRRKLRSSLEEM